MYKYKNVSEHAQTVIGFGVVQAGQEVVTSRPIHNPNFVLLESNDTPQVTGTQAQQPQAVTEVEPATTTKETNDERTA